MFTIKGLNGKDLSEKIVLNPRGYFNPREILKKEFLGSIFTNNAHITYDGQSISIPEIADLIANASEDDVLDPKISKAAKDFFKEALPNYPKNSILESDNVFLIQRLQKLSWPEPDENTIYTASTDVIPAAKDYIAGKAGIEPFLTAIMAFSRIDTLLFAFRDEAIFNEYMQFVKQEISKLQNEISINNMALFNSFYKTKLDKLTESYILRQDDSQNNDELSFARLLPSLTTEFILKNADTTDLSSYSLQELITPKTVTFVNVEQHAVNTQSEVTKAWNNIYEALQFKIHFITNNQLQKLTTVQQLEARLRALKGSKGNEIAEKIAKKPLSKTPPTDAVFTKCVMAQLKKMKDKNFSMNAYKVTTHSFNKPSRRHPEDSTKPGKSVLKRYLPDIHLYIDTSGSMSLECYSAAVKACIVLAKKLNVNLYFNSFSNVISECTLLKTEGKSVKQIYNEFLKVNKVTGGTNFSNVWNYINYSKKRQEELSLMITDFEYSPPRQYIKHPKNLFYSPVKTSDYEYILECANEFIESMKSKAPHIRSKLFM